MNIENEGSFKAAFERGVNLFLGAGFSVLSKNAKGQTMPVGPELGNEIRHRFGVDALGELSLPQLCTLVDATDHQGLVDFLTARCAVDEYDERYESLFKGKVECIFTTNIDDLVHCIFDNNPDKYLNDLDFAGSAAGDAAAVDYVALHGSIRDSRRPLRFASLDLATAYDTDRDRWTSFRDRIRRFPTVFLGYALADAGTLQAIASNEAGRKTLGDCWIQVREADKDSAVVAFLRALGMQIIVADTEELLEYATSVIANLAKAGPSTHVGSDRGNIPRGHQVPQRPIVDFYLGAPPTWSDIFSGSLVKTKHFRSAREAIFSGGPSVIAGIPGCGKTTLLMQLAAEMPFEGLRFLEENLNVDRAGLLLRRIGRQKALVLVDDVVNDIDVMRLLASAANVTVMGADRDYRLGTATHLLPAGTRILRVSDQTPEDLQAIWETIPLQVREEKLTHPVMEPGVSPSLFEFIQTNVTAPMLHERIAEAVSTLSRTDLQTAQLLVLACYVHGCRTPISMDMVLGFLGESFENYFDIRDKMVQIGELLHEYTGDLATEPQDYFTARSVLTAESVVRSVPRGLLRELLERLHREVSPVRIASYDIFRRSAFDHNVFGRAYHDVESAVDLYDHLIKRDQNEYIRQQKALFLADRGKYVDAFKEIDRARSRISRHRNWSIENSYFKILFGSNMPQFESDQAQEQLLRALAGLAECFARDKRKGMHALVFADCALRFSSKIRTEQAVELLTQSAAQLNQVIQDQPWLEKPPRLLGLVQRRRRNLERELGL